MKLINVSFVASRRLCVGCGACASICPNSIIKLINFEKEGIRPLIDKSGCQDCTMCVEVCPGIKSPNPIWKFSKGRTKRTKNPLLYKHWGPFIEFWEGFAHDSQIRYSGSSGGLCTALSLYCLENGMAGGVLHTGTNAEKPWENETVYSTTKENLLERTGSRYSPASPCDALNKIESSEKASVFVGKPCDIEGLRLAQDLRPALKEKTALSIGFFCAGTPSTCGTLELFKKYGVDPEQVALFRYRGMGWPGMATVTFKNSRRRQLQISYKDSWGFVNRFRPFRCYLCPDLTAEYADISVGDPWYRNIGEGEAGRSLILIRNEKGQEIFHKAIAQGYIVAEEADPEIIYRSQKNLLGKRRAIWGRLLAMKLFGIPCPQLKGFCLFENWLDLSLKEKIRSVLGTVKRIMKRNYFKPIKFK